MQQQSVFYLSDGTGITAANLGKSLLTQFESITFAEHTISDIATLDSAHSAVEIINKAASQQGSAALVFSTLINDEIRAVIQTSNAFVLDLFSTFIAPLEQHLGAQSSHSIGKLHSMADSNQYMQRINAMNFSLETDDGCHPDRYNHAELILVGVSRCGKTPTSLYLALQHGIYTANYPFTPEDLQDLMLPKPLRPFKQKLFGLTISPERLRLIRQERRPDSEYASLKNCQREIEIVESFFRQQHINHIDTTKRSIEEIAAAILARMK